MARGAFKLFANGAEAGVQGAEARLVRTTPSSHGAFLCSPLITPPELRRFPRRRVCPKRLNVPSRALRPCPVRALHELQQGLRRGGAVAYLLVSQERHTTLRQPARGLWTQRMFGQTLRLGGGVGVEGGLADVSITGPEAERDDLVRVRLTGNRVCALRQRHLFAGEAGNGQVEAVPVELNGAGLAGKTPGELLEDPIHPQEYPVVTPHVLPVADAVECVLIQRVLIVEAEGLRVYGGVYAQRAQPIKEPPVELCHRQVIEGEGELTFVARVHGELVLEQVKGDVEGSAAIRTIGDWAGGEPASGDIERNVPPVVPKRREFHPHLARNLAVAVQRLFGVLPVI